MKLFKSLLLALLIASLTTIGFAASTKLEDVSGIPRGVQIDAKGNIGVMSLLSITAGSDPNFISVHKFGEAPDFDTADNFVTIWDGADDGGIAQFVYKYSASALIDSISSSITGDTQSVELQGLDTNWALVVQTFDMTGQARKALTTPLVRIFRIKNEGATNFAGTVYAYENTTIGTGIPTDKTKIRAMVQIGNNQTLMAVYTIPAGYTGYMFEYDASGANGTFNNTGQSIIKLYARPFGGVFQLKRVIALSATGTSYPIKTWEMPEKFLEKTDLELRCNTTVDGSAIAGGFDLILVKNE